MRLATLAGAGATSLVVAAASLVALETPAAADTENCASHGEYDQLEVLWSPAHVSELFDIPGWISWVGDNSFRKSYHTCWDYDGTKIVVAYGLDDGLSFDWWTAPLG